MTALGTQLGHSQTSGTTGETRTAPLVTIVGYDGTPSARQALLAAAQLINGREGQIEAVWVAHDSGLAGLSATAEAGLLDNFNQLAGDLGAEVRTTLEHDEQRWTFQRRDGAVAHELLSAAHLAREELGPDATIVIVVGSSSHLYHQVIGSVPVNLAHQSEFPLLVVPPVDTAA